jgi:hypothetical protein
MMPEAANRFFRKVFPADENPTPRVVTCDKNPASPAALEALKADGTCRAVSSSTGANT